MEARKKTVDCLRRWHELCLDLSSKNSSFYSGCRKIISNVQWSTETLENIEMRQLGYTKNKYSQLTRNYLNPDSKTAALELWESRIKKRKYGSVGVSTYNHFKKGGGGPRGSIMGPCIQSVVLTLTDKGERYASVLYRTTEVFKKFPADLVWLRDVLLPEFGPLSRYEFFFVNVTVHPMYWVVLAPHLGARPDFHLSQLRARQPYFHDWVVKWTARYLCDEYHRGIAKFAQALRVQASAKELLSPAQLRALQDYCRKYHPGYRNDPQEDDDEDVE